MVFELLNKSSSIPYSSQKSILNEDLAGCIHDKCLGRRNILHILKWVIKIYQLEYRNINIKKKTPYVKLNTSDWVNIGNRHRRIISIWKTPNKNEIKTNHSTEKWAVGKRQFTQIQKRSKINIWKDAHRLLVPEFLIKTK